MTWTFRRDRTIDNDQLRQRFPDFDIAILADNLVYSSPLGDPRHLFYAITNGDAIVSEDPRTIRSDNDRHLDTAAFYALVQFGAVIPPRSIFERVNRFRPGVKTRICLNTGQRSETKPDVAEYLSADELQLPAVLESIIKEACPNEDPIILFSGGVDSGALAATVKHLGWSKATLLNYAFSDRDAESLVAEKMASHLNLEFVRITAPRLLSESQIRALPAAYCHPFGDHSVIPTFDLCRQLSERYGNRRVVIDGTGADGGFGLATKARNLERLYAVPRVVRAMVGATYGFRHRWMQRGKLEYVTRICRRSVDMEKATAGVALNSLHKLTYHFPQNVVADCLASFEEWQSLAMNYEHFEQKLSAADIALICSGIYAQKTQMPLRQKGFKVLFPFLHPSAIQFSMNSPVEAKSGKAQLKQILAEAVPKQLVYREKTGFVERSTVRMPEPFWADLMTDCMKDEAITRHICSVAWYRIRDRIARQVTVPDPVYHFVWTVVFLHLWKSSLGD